MKQWGKLACFGWFTAAIALAGTTTWGQEASSRPIDRAATTRPSSFYRAPVLMMSLQQIRGAIARMSLPEDQNTKATAVLDQAQEKADQLADAMQGSPPGQRAVRVNPFLQNLRQQLGAVLTPEEMQILQGEVTPRAGGPLQALQSNLASLNLTADQRQRVAGLMSDTRQQLQTLRQQAAGNSDMQQQADTLRQQMRSSLAAILTQQQLAQLGQAMQDRGVPANAPPPVAHSVPHAKPATQPNHPDVGAAAPDFHLSTVDGGSVSLADFQGQVLVIEFGSLTCPTFRDHAKEMEQLFKQYGAKAKFLVVYTREAHPIGGWEIQRNKDDRIRVSDPGDLSSRALLAERAENSLKITWPMVVDSMTEPACDAYGLFPNGAVVIGRDGKIGAVQEWASADGLQSAIDQVVGQ